MFSKADSEAGQSMLELALCLPFLVLVLSATVDLGRAANLHFNASRVAYEATRYAASFSGLESGSYNTPGSRPVGHRKIQERVDLLLARYGVKTDSDVNLTTARYETTEGKTEVKIQLQVAFVPLMYLSSPVKNLGAVATGPYLSEEK